MNDEIKEIKLDHFKNIEELKQNVETWIKEDEMYWNRWFGLSDLSNLLDYITNLQKENEKLKKEKKKLSNDLAEAILFNQKRCEQNKELKQRIDKAIKIIQNDTTLNPTRQRDRLINILNGGDEK